MDDSNASLSGSNTLVEIEWLCIVQRTAIYITVLDDFPDSLYGGSILVRLTWRDIVQVKTLLVISL